MSTPTSRCATAHPDDPTPCVGAQDIVKLIVPGWPDTLGCVHHTARSYATLNGPLVHPGHGGAESDQAALDVYYAAQQIRPYPWLTEKTDGGDPS